MPAISAATLAITSALTAATSAGATTAAAIASAGSAAIPGAGAAIGSLGGASAAGLGGTVGTVGVLGSLASTGAQMIYGQQAAKAQQEAEALRAKQMDLEAARARRQAIRESMQAYYTGLNNEAATGASVGQGTSVGGGLLGQTQSNLAANLSSINENQQIGQGIFAANARSSVASGNAALYGGANKLFSQLASPNTAFAAGNLLKTGLPNIFSST